MLEPTRDDYVASVEADLEAAESDDAKKHLRERLKRVKGAKTDVQAKKAYFGHVEEVAAAEAERHEEELAAGLRAAKREAEKAGEKSVRPDPGEGS